MYSYTVDEYLKIYGMLNFDVTIRYVYWDVAARKAGLTQYIHTLNTSMAQHIIVTVHRMLSDKMCINEQLCCDCLSDCRDKTVVNRYLLSVLVRLFLEKHEQLILKFVTDFSRLTVSDEKVNSLRRLLILHLLACYKTILVITVSAVLCTVWQIAVPFPKRSR